MRTVFRVLFAIFVTQMCLPAVAQTPYKIKYLGTLGGLIARPLSINDAGMVVGWSDYIASTPDLYNPLHHAFVWTAQHGMIDLGSLGGGISEATAVNQVGQVAGWSDTMPELLNFGPDFDVSHAFVWDRYRGLQDINQSAVAIMSHAYAINNLGEVAGSLIPFLGGYSTQQDYSTHAAYWDNHGGIYDLTPLLSDADSGAQGINDLGRIVGQTAVTSRGTPPFYPIEATVWYRTQGMVGLGTLGQDYSAATAINDVGTVVGSSYTLDPVYGFPELHAVRWDDQQNLQDLGTLLYGFDSNANAVNILGQIVGASGSTSVFSPATGPVNHAVLWDEYNVIHDLNTMIPVTRGWYLLEATGINDEGQIVGVLANGTTVLYYDTAVPVTRAVLLTPQAPPKQFAQDVTAQVSLQYGPMVTNNTTLLIDQRVKITNTGAQTLHGPLSLALDSLSLDSSLTNVDGYTNYLAPFGSPYINFDLGPGGTLPPSKSVTVNLKFATVYPPVTYNARVLAGTGGR